MILLVMLAVPLQVQGHHPLPYQPSAADCRASQASLRAFLARGKRPERLRALAMLNRCGMPVDEPALRRDADPEMRLAAWVLGLRSRVWTDPLWSRALNELPARQARSILRLRQRQRSARVRGSP